MGTIYNVIASKGCEVVGIVSVDGYRFDASAATVDENFVGLPCFCHKKQSVLAIIKQAS
ncbi:MAG: hypothetical protein JEZ14_09070 [Marinilabiliaceae bacterium]|nr:hypothetical protein [Marinilabiliaceae bacterium]